MTETPHVLGIIGYPLAHTYSPAIHNAMCKRLGLPYVYLPFIVAPRHLPNLLTCMRLTDVEGLNVTTPHKTRVVALLPSLDAEARAIGAVNTIALTRRGYRGYNTDAAGIAAALKRFTGETFRGRRVLLLGAGGAARAAAFAAARERAASILVVNRTAAHAKRLSADLGRRFRRTAIFTMPLRTAGLRRACTDVDTIIQATNAPAGTLLPLAWKKFPRDAIGIELRYGPAPTAFERSAMEHGLVRVDGVTILTLQAAASFRIWTGRSMDVPFALRIARKVSRTVAARV
ncbi:MAG: hypothetical protein HY543_01320 [Deltaproteobacteria bacterium]|nr:hypothetical protein [Deltaproteobacteria bacterium]